MFAYEPLPTSTSEVSTMTVLGPRRSWALAVCGLGALLLSGVLGYVMGHRRGMTVPLRSVGR